MRRLIHRLAPRLFFALTVLLVLIEGTFGVVNIRIADKQLVQEAITGADQLSRSVTAATWQAMRFDHREAAYELMETIADKHGVERIRMFNRVGELRFSTDEEEYLRAGVEAEMCRGCHDGPATRTHLPPAERARMFESSDGRRMLGMISPIYNEPSCYTASCHAHPEDLKVLGVLDLTTDIEHVDADLHAQTLRATLMSVVHVVMFGFVIYLFLRHFVGNPIGELIEATQAVSELNLERPVHLETKTELGDLARSFETMRKRLLDARRELEQFAHGLEDKVEERSRQLDATRKKLIQSDRLASLGQLSASVAHEINNPINGVLNLTMLMDRIMKADGIPPARIEEFRGYLKQASQETERVGRIVSDLLAFSRRPSPQRAPVDLNQVLHRTLSLIAHRLELARVELLLELQPSLPPVHGDRSQIEQVVLNLVMNAAEAMPDGGQLGIRTRVDADREDIVLEVKDQGVGIEPDHLARIFDPFFTTKGEGKGIGLGLSVVYGIVDAHGGTIDVTSKVGTGTTFVVRLPREEAEGNRGT